MKKKLAKKSNRGRKPNRAVLSGIKPDQQSPDEIRCRIIYGSNEWPIVALRHWLRELAGNSTQPLQDGYLRALYMSEHVTVLPTEKETPTEGQFDDWVRYSPFVPRDPPLDHRLKILWNRFVADLEHAVLNNDADWFGRQADAIKKGGSPQRARFRAKVVLLLDQAWSETLGRPENWRPLTNAERKAFPNLRRVPHVVTLTPAGKFTDKMASDIYEALDKRDVNGVLVVEDYQFESKERVMEAIHNLAKRLQFELKKQPRGNAESNS